TDWQAALKEALIGLKEAGLLLSAPAGIALTSPEQIQLATAASLSINAGQDASLSLMKRLTVAAGEAISLFAQKSGIKLFAARGKVDIQAQNNALNLAAQQDVSISSSQGKVLVNAKEEILLTSGGGYIRLKGGNIELGCPGDVTIKAIAMVKRGPSNMAQSFNSLPKAALDEEFVLQWPYGGRPVANRRFQLLREDGSKIEGITDANGKTGLQKSEFVDNIQLKILGDK
ncbi:MAG: DUF2345 domain-containing protein, partial [Iodobacter sp.]